MLFIYFCACYLQIASYERSLRQGHDISMDVVVHEVSNSRCTNCDLFSNRTITCRQIWTLLQVSQRSNIFFFFFILITTASSMHSDCESVELAGLAVDDQLAAKLYKETRKVLKLDEAE